MQDKQYFLYYFFESVWIRWSRVLLFFGIGVFVYFNRSQSSMIISLLPFYFVVILQELYIHFSLGQKNPSQSVNDKYRHEIECVTFKSRVELETHKSAAQAVRSLRHDSSIVFFTNLIGFKSLFENEVAENELLKKSAEVVVSVGGKFINPIDLYVSYLLLSEKETNILLNKNLTEKDILIVLSWVRKQFRIDDKKHTGLRFSGSGIFDFFVYGWSAELARYATNFTWEVLSQRRAEPIGRAREYDLLVTALSKSNSSNALLIGDAGIGKTALVAQFAADSNAGNLPAVSNKVVFKLFAERLLAGVANEGDLEMRFVSLFSELSHAGNIVIYIPNIENIFGGGGVNIDMSGALAEYLKSNRIKIIGSTTHAAYQSHIYQKQEIKELFDVIEFTEPKEDEAIFMILEKAKELEEHERMQIQFDAVKEIIALSNSYVNDGTVLPGRAVRFLEDTVTHCKTHGIKKVEAVHVQDFIQTKTGIVMSAPTEDESNKLLHLEEYIHKSLVSQDEAVSAIADAMRRVRTGMKEDNKPIASFLFLGPTGVGKTEAAKALALAYFGSEEAMIRVDMSEFQTPESVERLLGKSGSSETTIVDKVLTRPFSLLLLDEFEKAYPRVLDLFLQILDEGRLTDNLGRTVSFSQTIIIATSNAGSEFIREAYANGAVAENVKAALIEKIQETNIFKPELLNRFDDLIAFHPLTMADAANVARHFLDEICLKAKDQGIELSYDDQVADFVVAHAYSVEFGARNLRRFVEQSVENQLSKMMLEHNLVRGGVARIAIINGALVIGN